jgi:hypothetical protein
MWVAQNFELVKTGHRGKGYVGRVQGGACCNQRLTSCRFRARPPDVLTYAGFTGRCVRAQNQEGLPVRTSCQLSALQPQHGLRARRYDTACDDWGGTAGIEVLPWFRDCPRATGVNRPAVHCRGGVVGKALKGCDVNG